MQRDAADINAQRTDRFEARAKRQARRVIRRIVGVALFIGACIWVFNVWSLWFEYQAAFRFGRIAANNLSAACALDLTLTLDSAAQQLRRIQDGMRSIPPDEPAGDIQTRLRALITPGTLVRIVGPDGRRLFSSLDADPGPEDVRQPPHFIAHRDDPSTDPMIDPYAVDPAGSFIELSQRLDTSDGRFAGEAILLLKPNELLTLNRRFDLGRRGMIVVSDTSGIVRAGYDGAHPDGSVGVGTDLTGHPYPDHLAAGEAASYSRVGRVIPLERLVAIRALDRYRLRVAAVFDVDDVLGIARNQIWLVGLVGLSATGLMAALTALLSREVWRRTKREIELAYDRDQLRTAQLRIDADRAQLEQTNRELQASKESAEAANRARSQFLAHMSHELRTPLHAIIGFSELIQDQASPKSGVSPIAGYAADIWTSGRHLLELINAILDISKVESGTATLTESVFPIAELVRGSLVSIRTQAETQGIAVELRLPETTMRVRADRTRLLQILINLLSNAVKFTPAHGRIVVTAAESPARELMFSVADNGIGMTEAEIEIALEPFGQVDSALSRSFEGTGLGLPLAYKLTQLHGGRLELTSVKGQGTTVTVTLPAERLVQRDGARVGGN